MKAFPLAELFNDGRMNVTLFPGVRYTTWGFLPDADTYVCHSFHKEHIPTLLPYLIDLNITICALPHYDPDVVWIGMTYPDFDRLYEAAAPSLNYSWCDPRDKEYELIYSYENESGELLSEGRTEYVIGNYQSTEEGCEGCGKVVTGNRKRAICPNCGEDVYMS